ncbi:Na+/H+ antiporter [Noviherbaspirillum massiliense]|uniref:Na+/H+ antiporter n=1 Tax=Noviherbaspirillum massiliense TaxID=1465823 RepID=UPI0003138662|nr:Na+/H+ antiporter [Noviherbaspirillum massiliense]
MQTVTMVLVLLLAVVVSGFLARLSPVKLPLPLVQIAAGAALSYAFGFNVPLDPEIFFLLFIPPLLFLDGWRIPKGAFFRDLRPILTLAIGLVIFTVVGMGVFIDWLIPAMPLAVAFALAAILSPTDPVAVSAIASRAPIPSRLMHILEGESLLNDASGLVCFRFAVAAALTGGFSLTSASWSFVQVAGGGLLVGIAVALVIGLANQQLVRFAGEDPGIQILISLLIPFSAYLAAEHLHVSGILASAVAGITMHYADLIGRPLATTRIQRHVVWDMLQMVLNGAIFVLLGEQLPGILAAAAKTAQSASIDDTWNLFVYVILITLALAALRFLWVWASLRLTLFRAPRSVDTGRRPFKRMLLVTAFAGVKGAITLAGILTLPLTMSDGTPFPARDLAIFLAMGVILLSLLIASVALPLLTSGLEFAPQAPQGKKEGHARSAAAEAAIRRVEQVRTAALRTNKEDPWMPEAASRVIDLYRKRLDYGHAVQEESERATAIADAERRLRIEALRAERDELYRLRISGLIDDPLHQRLLREIDLIEAALTRK